jgi:hypothetical protein
MMVSMLKRQHDCSESAVFFVEHPLDDFTWELLDTSIEGVGLLKPVIAVRRRMYSHRQDHICKVTSANLQSRAQRDNVVLHCR